ncbi:MAG TPA: sugar ABC transporter substrate-binding protein, partial [Chthoniobacterales bacterium]|nr:sugar ABC transporter substrate-binding protein [Chthoniobacterales bacterium]
KLRSLIGIVLATWLVAPSPVMAQKQLHIIVVTHGAASDSFWAPVKNGADEAGKQTGALVEYRAPEKFDMVAMAQLIEASVAAKPDGLVVTIPDADALGGAIKAAINAKVPIVSTNSGWDVSKKLGIIMHVGQEEFIAGKGAGERMKGMGVKKAVVINHLVGNVALDLRAKGFIEGLGQNAEVLATTLDFTEARNAISAYLQKVPDLEAVMTLGPNGAEPAIQALEAAGKLGKLKFGTFDLSPAILQTVAKGQMDFAIDQQPFLQGWLPVAFLVNYIKYGVIPSQETVFTGPNFVTPENAAKALELSKHGLR